MNESDCNCWNCKYLVPALKDKLYEFASELDDRMGWADDTQRVDEAIELCEGKVRVPASV